MNPKTPLLSLRISAGYKDKPGVLHEVSLDVMPGEIVALVGQSGSGKSTLSLAILRLLDMRGGRVSGEIHFAGSDLLQLSEAEMRDLRGRQIALVLQSPHSSLNPALRIKTQLAEAWSAHAKGNGRTRRDAIVSAMSSVSLPDDDDFLRRFPAQLSVGQAQRVLIAMAILHHPALLIADEPTSALDVITQSEVLGLFGKLNREMGMAILFISHDLLTVASLCHRVAILHEGQIVESGPTERVFARPEHPYTCRLLNALPRRAFEDCKSL